MATWSEKRKFAYAAIVVTVVLLGVGIPAFLILYKAPTCFDGINNGGEQGVDCGGRCSRLCQSNFLAPNIAWTRLEKITPELYNAAAYIINPNTDGEAKNVPYHMALYDKNGLLIVDESGSVTIPPHRNTLAFQSAINVGNRTPSRVLFEFTSLPDWNKKADGLSAIAVESKDYSEDSSGSSLQVKLKNNSVQSLGRIGVYVVLYDNKSNAIGFSKTVIDGIAPNGTIIAPFTWNIDRKGSVVSIEALYVAE